MQQLSIEGKTKEDLAITVHVSIYYTGGADGESDAVWNAECDHDWERVESLCTVGYTVSRCSKCYKGD